MSGQRYRTWTPTAAGDQYGDFMAQRCSGGDTKRGPIAVLRLF
jgi:hypothetical protein